MYITKLYFLFPDRFAFQYNPSLQPRALVVFGCISKRVTHGQLKQIIRILSKASPLLSIDRVSSVCFSLSCNRILDLIVIGSNRLFWGILYHVVISDVYFLIKFILDHSCAPIRIEKE